MKLFITTQYMENYGAHDWNGEGECPQYWKMKGGDDYYVMLDGYNPNHEFAEKNLRMIVDSIRDRIEWNTVDSRQYIIEYRLVADDFLTEFERSQLEYDGTITYPTTVLSLVDNVEV
jgi:hypothetical protein